MAEIINLKEKVLDYRPCEFSPFAQMLRYHSLEVLNYIEKCENLVVNPEERCYNEIKSGELKII